MSAASTKTIDLLAGISAGRSEVLDEVLAAAERGTAIDGVEPRVIALVRLAVLFALDAPPASYADEVASAVEAGASADEIAAALLAVAPQIGRPRTVAAAPELMLALGIPLSGGPGGSS